MGVLGMLGVVLDSILVGHIHDHTSLVSRGEAYVGSFYPFMSSKAVKRAKERTEVVGGGIADSVACGMDEAAVQRQFASLLDLFGIAVNFQPKPVILSAHTLIWARLAIVSR